MKLVNPRSVQAIMDTQTGKPIDQQVLDRDMRRIYGLGYFEHVHYRYLDEPEKRILVVEAVEKSRGLKKGERARTLGVLKIVSVRVEPLSRLVTDGRYAEDELPREGFPCWSRDDFIAMFLRVNSLKSTAVKVTRIEFEYVQADNLSRR